MGMTLQLPRMTLPFPMWILPFTRSRWALFVRSKVGYTKTNKIQNTPRYSIPIYRVQHRAGILIGSASRVIYFYGGRCGPVNFFIQQIFWEGFSPWTRPSRTSDLGRQNVIFAMCGGLQPPHVQVVVSFTLGILLFPCMMNNIVHCLPLTNMET